MAVKNTPSTVERPDHTRLQSGSEGQPIKTSNQKTVIRTSDVADADFDIVAYDLVDDGDWDLSTEKASQFTGSNPNPGGSSTIGIFVESSDDAQFSISIEWKDEDDNTLGTVDQDIDSDLLSTSPSGGNHYVYVTVAMSSDRFNVVITDESAANNNTINGTVNAH